MNGWKQFAELVCDFIEPSLVGKPKYFLSDSEAVSIERSLSCLSLNASGWTSRVADLLFADELVERGSWQGRSFCCVVDEGQHRRLEEVAATVGHELAHWISFGGVIDGSLKDPSALSQQWLTVTRQAAAKTVSVATIEPKKSPSAAMTSHHDAKFVRAACHAAYRLRRAIPSLRPEELRFVSPYHKGCTESQFMKSLSSELVTRASHSIFDVLRSPVPQPFADLWHRATGRKLSDAKVTRSNGKPFVYVALEGRRVKRQAIIQRDGESVMAILADEKKPRANKGDLPEYLLLSGFSTRANHSSIPLADGDIATARNIIGSVRSMKVNGDQLHGVVGFASDDQAQRVHREFIEGKRKTFELTTEDKAGVEVSQGQTYMGIPGPSLVITNWRPLHVTTKKGG